MALQFASYRLPERDTFAFTRRDDLITRDGPQQLRICESCDFWFAAPDTKGMFMRDRYSIVAVMKCLFLLAVLVPAISLIACGGSPHPPSASGSWSAALSTSAGQQAETFTFNLTQNDIALSASSLGFNGMDNISQCFGVGTTLSGSLSSAVNGGSMTMAMVWTSPDGTATNTMTMQGNMTMGMASSSGTFTLTGQTFGCASQSGIFTMARAFARSMAANP